MNAPLLPPESLAPVHPPAVMPDEPVIPLTVEAYHALIDAGIYQSGDPIELLEGFVVPKMTRGSRHEMVRRRLFRQLRALVADEFLVDTQGAATLLNSEPEPDVFVIRGSEEDYPDRHAGPEETVFVAEVADSSLRRDRGLTQRVYARAKVPVYWIVNLIDDCIEVFSQPSGSAKKPKYEQQMTYRANDEILVVIDGKVIGRLAAETILGKSG